MVAILLLLSTCIFGQEDIYNVNVGQTIGEIKWMEQSINGTILLGGSTALAGFNNKTGEQDWVVSSLTKPKADSYRTIEPLSLFIIKGENEEGKSEYNIINSEDGSVVYSTTDKLLQVRLDMDNGVYYVEVAKKREHQLIKVDASTNMVKWEHTFSDKGGLGNLRYGKSIFFSQPIFHSKIIVACKNRLMYGIDPSSGDILWETEYKYDLQFVELIGDGDQLMVVSDKRLNIINPISGEKISKEPIKLKKKINWTSKISEEDLLVAGDNGYNIYNMASASMQFEKDIVHYGVMQIDQLENGDFLSYGGSKMNYILKSGKQKWSKTVDANLVEVHYYPNEQIFCEYAGSVEFRDLNNGKKIKGSNMYFSKASPSYFDKDEGMYYVYHSKKLKVYDIEKKSVEEIARKLKLKKYSSETTVLDLEKREDSYLVSSGQHLMSIGFDGTIQFNDYYPINKQSTSLAEFALASEFGEGTAAALLDDGKRTSTSKTIQNNGSILGVDINSKRMNASFVSDQYLFTFTRDDDGPCFKKVNKDTGEVEATIRMKDRDPTYIIDEYDKLLIIAEGKDVLKASGL